MSEFLNFVLFVTFVVQRLFRFWLRLCRARTAVVRIDSSQLQRGTTEKPYNGNQRPLAAGESFIPSGRCGLLIGSFHGDGAPL
jgi:hypothetical protein